MAQQTINLGTVANDGTGDTLRDGGDKINDNFTELYAGLTGLLDFKGSTDASANPNYPAASKGDYYLVSVAGKVGGASGVVVEAGDSYFALADNAGGTQAGVGASWTVVQGNIAYVPVNKAGDTMTGDLIVPDEAYDATAWNGSLEVPTKNAVRDKIEAVVAGAGSVSDTAYGVGWDGDTTTAPSKNAVYDKIESLAGGGFTAASTTEVLTGTDSAKGVTPDALAALWEQGADVASAGTTSLGEGGYFNITGTTTITDIDFATDKAGRRARVKFAGILTLTHNASTLILPTGANITTAAGDTAEFVSEGSDVVRCVSYQRASGASLASSSAHIFAKNASAPSGSTSTAAFASKGQVFVALENVTISRIYFKFTPVNTGTYICGIYQIGADLVIDSGTDTTSRTTLGTTNNWFAFDFASPVNVLAGDRFYMALTRTDSTTTYVLPTSTSGSNGNFVGLPLTMEANTFRIADVAPAAADTVLDSGSTASLEMGVIGWLT